MSGNAVSIFGFLDQWRDEFFPRPLAQRYNLAALHFDIGQLVVARGHHHLVAQRIGEPLVMPGQAYHPVFGVSNF